MDARTKEASLVLRGRFGYDEDGVLIIPTRNPLRVRSGGALFGGNQIWLLGITVRKYQYQITGEMDDTLDGCVRALLRLGRQVVLPTAPESLAVLHIPVAARPAVLTLDVEEDQLLLCIYRGRALLGKAALRRLFEKWDKIKPEGLQETELTMTPPCHPVEKE